MERNLSKLGMAVRKWRSTSLVSIPRAVNTPGITGSNTRLISRLRAKSQAWIGPLPPNATNVKSRASIPRSTLTARLAPAILALVTSRTPYAASSMLKPNGLASPSAITCRARSISSVRVPPASSFGRYPSTAFASLTVGFMPPCP